MALRNSFHNDFSSSNASASKPRRFKLEHEGCTPEVSAALRLKLRVD
jgi:hypothetical protein